MSQIGYAMRCVPGPTVTVSPTSYTFPSTGGTKNDFTVATTNFTGTLEVSDNATWLNSSISGTTLTLTAEANSSTTSTRSATVTITADTYTATVNITQNAAPTVTVSPTSYTFPSTGGTKNDFTVATTNFTGALEVSDNATWLNSSISGTTLTLTAGANSSTTSARSATVTITAGTATATVNITQNAAPTVTVDASATFATLGETQTFTVSTTNFTGTPTVKVVDTSTGNTPSWITTASLSGTTLTVTTSQNKATTERAATLTLTAGTATATMSITQKRHLAGGENYVLYFTGDARYPMKVGRWDTSLTTEDTAAGIVKLTEADRQKLLYFKFGSVIGFDFAGTFDGEVTAIKFNPSNLTVGTNGDIKYYGTGGSLATLELPAIPAFTPTDWNNGVRNISDATYHNATNIANNGKGDPCKLAGMDMNRKNESGYLAGYDSGWRLPTNDENRMFVGLEPAGTTIAYFNTGDGYYSISPDSEWSATNPGTGIFPANTTRGEDPRLPAGGFKDTTEPEPQVGMHGYFWSSIPYNATDDGSTNAYRLHFTSSWVEPIEWNRTLHGFAARCVRK
jgi:hypothetical protein